MDSKMVNDYLEEKKNQVNEIGRMVIKGIEEAEKERINTLETNSTNAMMYWKGKIDAYQEVANFIYGAKYKPAG